MTLTKFTDEVEIDAPTQVGLVVTGPGTGVGAGAQLTTKGTGGRGWEILATGQTAAQGRDKLNIRDLGNGQDVLTITSNGNVGIGTTSPGAKLEIDAPTQAGVLITGPGTGVGAGAQLFVNTGVGKFLGWQILATGSAAAQGSDKLNIARQSVTLGVRSSVDVFTITGDGKVGIGTTSPGFKLEIDAPDQLGLRITGPNTNSVGAGINLKATDPGDRRVSNSWEILATGSGSAQGASRLNIRDVDNTKDILTILQNAIADPDNPLNPPVPAIGVGTTTPTQRLDVNGKVQAQDFVNVSSREIKDNILNLCSQEAFEALEHLSPVKFNYKMEDARNVHIGFIAEDVPELVATSDRKGVSFTEIVAIITQVVKEQQKTIQALAEKIHMLESPPASREVRRGC